MIVNFKSVPCQSSLKNPEIKMFDLAQDLGEAIYTRTTNTEDFDLALKIFNSGDEGVDLTDQEIINTANYIGGFPVWVQKGIVSVLQSALQAMIEQHAEAEHIEPAEEKVSEPRPGDPSPDGGMYAGDDGVPAPATWVDLEEEEKPKKTTKKKK